MSLKLQAKIPRAFINFGARAHAEFEVLHANSHMIMSGFLLDIDKTLVA